MGILAVDRALTSCIPISSNARATFSINFGRSSACTAMPGGGVMHMSMSEADVPNPFVDEPKTVSMPPRATTFA